MNCSGFNSLSRLSLNHLMSRFHQHDANILFLVSSLKRYLIIFAGTPPTIAYGGTSFVTTLPIAIIAPVDTLTPPESRR